MGGGPIEGAPLVATPARSFYIMFFCYFFPTLTSPKQHLCFLSLLLVLDLQPLRLYHDRHEEERRAGEHDEGDGAAHGVAPLGQGHGVLNRDCGWFIQNLWCQF